MDTVYRLTSAEPGSRFSEAALAWAGFSLLEIVLLTAVLGLVIGLALSALSIAKSRARLVLWLRTKQVSAAEGDIAADEKQNWEIRTAQGTVDSQSGGPKRRFSRPLIKPA